MLEAVLRKSRRINDVKKQDKSVYLYSESGIIRITPIKTDLVRISYTEEKDFALGQGEDYAGPVFDFSWTLSEDDKFIEIETEDLIIRVERESGSVIYLKDEKVLLKESPIESKITEKFESFLTLSDTDADVEEINTADGIKKRIKAAKREFDRILYHTRVNFEFDEEEILYGLGQSPEGVWNRKGSTEYLHQGNMKSPIPILISSKGYGIMLSTRSVSMFEDSAFGSFMSAYADKYLDYYFFEGNLKNIVKSMRYLTGKASMLPQWSFGYIQSQERYESADELLDTALKFKELEFPISAIVQDWLSWPDGLWGQKSFDPKRYPDPKALTDKLHDMNIRMVLSVWPNMSEDGSNHKEFEEANLFLPNSNLYNPFVPEGRELYWKQANEGIFQYGVDGWWGDNCEPVAPEWERKYQPEPATAYLDYIEAATKLISADELNVFCLDHGRTLYEGQRNSGSEKRVFNLTRSVYPGSQSMGAVVWSGDISASWKTLRNQVRAGISFCSTGMPYWNLDIGGFFIKKGEPWYWNGDYNNTIDDPDYIELYLRWFEYGAFLPIMRCHGTDARREPWEIGAPGSHVFEILKKRTEDRYRLMPYIYSLAGQTAHKDELMMRPLTYDFPVDPNAALNGDEFMFGPSLLVCPVCLPRNIHKGNYSVFLPKIPECDVWYDFYTHEKYSGVRNAVLDLSDEHIPVFVPAGSIIPMNENGKNILYIFEGKNGEFEIYIDDGDGYQYEKGTFCFTKVSFNNASKEVSLSYEGNPHYQYKFEKIVFVG